MLKIMLNPHFKGGSVTGNDSYKNAAAGWDNTLCDVFWNKHR